MTSGTPLVRFGSGRCTAAADRAEIESWEPAGGKDWNLRGTNSPPELESQFCCVVSWSAR